ncbi:MAG: hypothetical protein GX458_14650, partial [Phyllobacteriaceae bacterium]|nr:hypothetical protein [Phyllobacteriaceae bacterium]
MTDPADTGLAATLERFFDLPFPKVRQPALPRLAATVAKLDAVEVRI